MTDYERAVGWATDWSQRWFLDAAGRDRLRVDGIDAGWATHVEALGILLPFALRRVGVPDSASGRSVTATLKRAGLDRVMRSVGLRLSARGSAADSPRATSVAIVEIPTPSMTEGVMRVAQRVDVHAPIGVADPRAARRLRGARTAVVPLTLPLGEERAAIRHSAAATRDAWRRVRDDPPHMELDGEDVAAEALAALKPLVERSVPWLAPERVAVTRFLEAARPRAVLLASDQHRIGRLAVQAAGDLGIRSVVLQHGLPQGRIGLLPVIADRMAVWSPHAARWFIENGTAADRVVETGNPRFDALLEEVARCSATDPSQRGRVLLALSPNDAALNERVVALTVEALGHLPASDLVVKLHPGQGSWHWLPAALRDFGDRVRVARHEPLSPLLAEAAVTLVHRTTVVIESLAAGVPVIVVGAGTPNARADLPALDLPMAASGDALAQLITRFSSDRDAYFRDRAPALRDALGPLDGDAGGRVARLLRDEAA